jgi:hypothetical protein
MAQLPSSDASFRRPAATSPHQMACSVHTAPESLVVTHLSRAGCQAQAPGLQPPLHQAHAAAQTPQPHSSAMSASMAGCLQGALPVQMAPDQMLTWGSVHPMLPWLKALKLT